MFYYANFKDIDMMPFRIEINTEEGGLSEYELTLSGTPVIIKQEGSDLFAPIKGTTCTINIESDGGLFDLYTTDPQGVKVVVTDLANAKVVFRGYATPMQYEQDWTTIDTLSLECVDCVSSLKNIPYQPISGERQYKSVRKIIENCFVHAFPEDEDSIFRWFRYYWPQHNFKSANDYNFSTTREMIDNISLNEANFFDDDDQETPWSYWQVLEEICKYFGVSLVCYKGAYWFIDYLYTATTNPAVAWFWQYDLENNYYSVSLSKAMTFNPADYAGGTAEISTDDTYNIVAVNTNRYDIDEIAPDPSQDDLHISITKERNMGGDYQVFTHTVDYFWWFQNDEVTRKYVYKKYCRFDPAKSKWRNIWYHPDISYGATVPWPNYYSSNAASYSQFNVWEENKWINCLGSTIVHYAVLDSIKNKPTKLDWKTAIMFQRTTDIIQLSDMQQGKIDIRHIDELQDLPMMKYEEDYEMNYSPKDGTSWLVFNCALWWQQNFNKNNKSLIITDPKQHTNFMVPVDELTDYPAYPATIDDGDNWYIGWSWSHNTSYFGRGWQLLKLQLQIGDKYWDGENNQWTTTPSTFNMSFSSESDRTVQSQGGAYITQDKPYDTVQYLDWMQAVSNTDYEDKVGIEGYAIPITAEDAVCGKLKLTIYCPAFYPLNYRPSLSSVLDRQYDWYDLGPIVYMKDFKVDYVYTDETEWYLSQETNTDDVKYINDTKDRYKYTKENTFKINSWQDQRPISKSFPIIRFDDNNTEVCEYLDETVDASNYDRKTKQEEQIIDRQLRHFAEPRKKYTCHRKSFYAPYSKIQLSDASEIDGIFVVGSQEYDVRNRNNTVELIEFGDAQIYTE